MKYYDYTDNEVFAVIKCFEIEKYTIPDEKQRLMSDFLRLDAEEHRKQLSISLVKKSIKYTEKKFK